jgi:hypothetical protein
MSNCIATGLQSSSLPRLCQLGARVINSCSPLSGSHRHHAPRFAPLGLLPQPVHHYHVVEGIAFPSKPANPNSGACPKSVGPIPVVLGQRSEGAQAEKQETADDGHESHRNQMETAEG